MTLIGSINPSLAGISLPTKHRKQHETAETVIASTAFTAPATCAELPVKSTVARSPLIVMRARIGISFSLMPSSSSASSASYVPSGISEIARRIIRDRSEEHTSELQSHSDLVCRLLLEKKKKIKK